MSAEKEMNEFLKNKSEYDNKGRLVEVTKEQWENAESTCMI